MIAAAAVPRRAAANERVAAGERRCHRAGVGVTGSGAVNGSYLPCGEVLNSLIGGDNAAFNPERNYGCPADLFT